MVICPSQTNAQRSVEIAYNVTDRTAFQSTTWFSCGRGGG
jgi:hypothetical protein